MELFSVRIQYSFVISCCPKTGPAEILNVYHEHRLIHLVLSCCPLACEGVYTCYNVLVIVSNVLVIVFFLWV